MNFSPGKVHPDLIFEGIPRYFFFTDNVVKNERGEKKEMNEASQHKEYTYVKHFL